MAWLTILVWNGVAGTVGPLPNLYWCDAVRIEKIQQLNADFRPTMVDGRALKRRDIDVQCRLQAEAPPLDPVLSATFGRALSVARR
jgi:hypothetical protein